MSQSDRSPRLVVPRTIGQLLLDYRRLQKIRQETLAMDLGVRPATLGDWENGRSKPQSRFFPEIAKRLGVSPEVVANTVHGHVVGADDDSAPLPASPADKELDIRLNISRRLATDPPPSEAAIALMLELLHQTRDDAQQQADASQSATARRPMSSRPASRDRRGQATAS